MNSSDSTMTYAQRAAMSDTAGDRARVGQALTPLAESASDWRPVISTWEHTFQLLALAAAFDGRERGRYEAEAWLKALSGHVIEDVERAITAHYRRSRYPVMPADVTDIIEEGL